MDSEGQILAQQVADEILSVAEEDPQEIQRYRNSIRRIQRSIHCCITLLKIAGLFQVFEDQEDLPSNVKFSQDSTLDEINTELQENPIFTDTIENLPVFLQSSRSKIEILLKLLGPMDTRPLAGDFPVTFGMMIRHHIGTSIGNLSIDIHTPSFHYKTFYGLPVVQALQFTETVLAILKDEKKM